MHWHVALDTEGRRTAFPHEASRRAAACTIARVTSDRAVLYSAVDEHVHTVLEGTRAEVGYLGRSLRSALSASTGERWRPAWIKLVDDRSYFEWLVAYVLWQPAHHGVSDRPALWAGSCFQDLLGARIVEGFAPERLALALPRFRLESVFKAAGIRDRVRPLPVGDDAIRLAGPHRLVEAAAAAIGAPHLHGREPLQMAARRAVAHLGQVAGMPASEAAYALDCSRVTVRRLLDGPRDERIERAVRLQLGLAEAADVVTMTEKPPRSAWIPPPDDPLWGWRRGKGGVHFPPASRDAPGM